MKPLDSQRLQVNHRRLDEEIKRTMRQRWVDPLKLQQLKKQKLAIKDRLHWIARSEGELRHTA